MGCLGSWIWLASPKAGVRPPLRNNTMFLRKTRLIVNSLTGNLKIPARIGLDWGFRPGIRTANQRSPRWTRRLRTTTVEPTERIPPTMSAAFRNRGALS